LAFLDEEKEQAPPPEVPERPRRPEGGPRRRRQQLIIRRLIGVGVVLGFVILVVLAFRGCLEARKERGIRNYVTDVNTIMTESEQRGKDFFDLLDSPTASSPREFEDTVRQIRGSSESLLDRANDLDVPGDMSEAQDAITLSLRLRRDALEKIADNTGEATANAETADAVETITNQMGSLYSSDVLYTQVAVPQIDDVLSDQGISAVDLSGGNFMPDPDPSATQNVEWLDPTNVQDALAGVTGTEITSGTHGLGLVQVAIGGTQLDPDIPNSVSANDQEIAVDVQNQGSTEEADVEVVVSIEGEELPHATIASIAPGATETAKLAITAIPEGGSEVTLQVVVTSVPGEADSSNNEASYAVTFG
jgi:CARDB